MNILSKPNDLFYKITSEKFRNYVCKLDFKKDLSNDDYELFRNIGYQFVFFQKQWTPIVKSTEQSNIARLPHLCLRRIGYSDIDLWFVWKSPIPKNYQKFKLHNYTCRIHMHLSCWESVLTAVTLTPTFFINSARRRSNRCLALMYRA